MEFARSDSDDTSEETGSHKPPMAVMCDAALGETNLLVSHWDKMLSLILSVG